MDVNDKETNGEDKALRVLKLERETLFYWCATPRASNITNNASDPVAQHSNVFRTKKLRTLHGARHLQPCKHRHRSRCNRNSHRQEGNLQHLNSASMALAASNFFIASVTSIILAARRHVRVVALDGRVSTLAPNLLIGQLSTIDLCTMTGCVWNHVLRQEASSHHVVFQILLLIGIDNAHHTPGAVADLRGIKDQRFVIGQAHSKDFALKDYISIKYFGRPE